MTDVRSVTGQYEIPVNLLASTSNYDPCIKHQKLCIRMRRKNLLLAATWLIVGTFMMFVQPFTHAAGSSKAVMLGCGIVTSVLSLAFLGLAFNWHRLKRTYDRLLDKIKIETIALLRGVE